jgi:hypothetical protein
MTKPEHTVEFDNIRKILQGLEASITSLRDETLQKEAEVIAWCVKPENQVKFILAVGNSERRYKFDIVCTQFKCEPISRNGSGWNEVGARCIFVFRVVDTVVIFNIECYHRLSRGVFFYSKNFTNTCITVQDSTGSINKDFNNMWLGGVTRDHKSPAENETECDPLDLSCFGEQKSVVEACMLLLLEKQKELEIGF